MPRDIQQIKADFAAFTESDFDLSNEQASGMGRLNELADELRALNQPSEAADMIMEFMERLGECDLGSPGPLVHTLEKLPNYEAHLCRSVKRKPTPLAMWMLNRILNVTEDEDKRGNLLLLLHQSLIHPFASAETKRNAKHFIDYQTEA